MNEKTRKTLLYFRRTRTYWNSTEGVENRLREDLPIGHYPQSIEPRIVQGHYDHFDADGVPCLVDSNGNQFHHYTTACSFAIGMWERYLKTGSQSASEIVIKVADFLARSKTELNGAVLFLDLDETTGEASIPCAMNQGEAISVLIRAHALTQRTDYLELAQQAITAFERPFDDNGVVGIIDDKTVWYLEAGKFILNGHCYAVIGLGELAAFTQDSKTDRLFRQGVKSIEQTLPKFDTGFWSRYWIQHKEYLASMMYHNLHIVQLESVGKMAESKILTQYAQKFERYARNPLNRIWAAFGIAKAKFGRT